MDAAALDARYRQFQEDPWAQFRVELKRCRAEQLRSLLADPATMLLDTFNREVWNHELSTTLDGQDITGFANLPAGVDARALTGALRAGRLELHGNYLWNPGSRVYGSMLHEDAPTKLEYVRRAIAILNQPGLVPADQAREIERLPGFGRNTASGLVMIFHPADYALSNRESAAALAELGYDSSPERFQASAQALRDLLGAEDCIELDVFLYWARRNEAAAGRAYWWVNQGRYYDQERAEGVVFARPRSTDGRVLGHRLNVRRLSPGDVLLHYADGALRAVGVVAAPPEPVHDRAGGPSEATDNEDAEAYRARVDYRDVASPLPLDRIPADWRREEPAEGPFNREGGAKEGYLFPLTEWFADQLWRQFGDQLPPLPTAAAWLFQANPRVFPFAEELKNQRVGDEDDWLVTSHRRELRPGQPVLLWQGGSEAGVCAVGELTSEPFERPPSPWRGEQAGAGAMEWAVKFRYTRILDRPIPKARLLEHAALRDMLILRSPQGTNFRVSAAEWQALEALLRPTDPVTFAAIQDALAHDGLHFSDEILSNYLLALQTKRFVILTGISGTGKTRLAMAVARAFQPRAGATGAEADLRVVAVRPDWVDNRGLLGYFNPLTGRYVTTPFLDLVLDARRECERAVRDRREPEPRFVVLDEMNLARVEHYFSDFLSAMESDEPLDLHAEPALEAAGADGPAIPRRLAIPPNLFFTGTVNVDETTAMFSPKVLDRAFTIELEEVDLAGYGADAAADAAGALRLTDFPGRLPPARRPAAADWAAFGAALDGAARALLIELNALLAGEHRHFGYRAANEIARFVTLAAAQTDGSPEAVWAALDLAVLAKVLPKFHGTQGELGELLAGLFRFAVFGECGPLPGGAEGVEEAWTPIGSRLARTSAAAEGWPAAPRLPRTAAKLWRMLRRLRRQGFTSFIE